MRFLDHAHQPGYPTVPPTRRRATNQVAEPEPGRRQRGSMSSRVRPDGAAALLDGGPVRARRARREVDGRRLFVGTGLVAAARAPIFARMCGRFTHRYTW